jgi:hypothetical protein
MLNFDKSPLESAKNCRSIPKIAVRRVVPKALYQLNPVASSILNLFLSTSSVSAPNLLKTSVNSLVKASIEYTPIGYSTMLDALFFLEAALL